MPRFLVPVKVHKEQLGDLLEYLNTHTIIYEPPHLIGPHFSDDDPPPIAANDVRPARANGKIKGGKKAGKIPAAKTMERSTNKPARVLYRALDKLSSGDQLSSRNLEAALKRAKAAPRSIYAAINEAIEHGELKRLKQGLYEKVGR